MKIKLKNAQSSPVLPKERQIRILGWHDAPHLTLGFGIVAKHILRALHNTGRYDIKILGINYDGGFYDQQIYPYQMVPAAFPNPQEPYGQKRLLQLLHQNEIDILFIINDSFVSGSIGNALLDLQGEIRSKKRKPFRIIHYYPVDGDIHDEWLPTLKISDRTVAYTNFAAEMSKARGLTPTDVIYHGTDTKNYYPLSPEERKKNRSKYFSIDNDETFLWMNINRNGIRKNLPQTLAAFAEFHKKHPNSKLYLHTCLVDGHHNGGMEINLAIPCRQLGLELGKNVMFPKGLNQAHGIPDQYLNEIVNCADGCVTTTMGEGFGISVPIAMTCNVPVVAPNNSSHPEILGNGRGYLYECKEVMMVENTGLRNIGRLEDVVEKMEEVYQERGSSEQKIKVTKAKLWSHKYSWENICKEWIKLFDEVAAIPHEETIGIEEM